MPQQIRFHIWFGDKRTTISVDQILFELMAIRLKTDFNSDEAHGIVKEWLQENLVAHLGDEDVRKSASQWARRYLIEEIADRRIMARWYEQID